MDPDFVRSMSNIGANCIILGMPKGTEFGINLNSWTVGEKFKGIKLIPPGIHFIYFSAVNKEGDVAPRTGLFHNFKEREVLVFHYDPTIEDIYRETNEEQVERIRSNIRNMDQELGPFPIDSWAKWMSLIQHINYEHIEKMQPVSGRICSASELVYTNEDKQKSTIEASKDSSSHEELATDAPTSKQKPFFTTQLPDMKPRPGTELRFSKLPEKPYRDGASPQEITKGSIDSSYSLDYIFSQLTCPEEILSELQFSFCCFLVGQVWDGWEHWRHLIMTICQAEENLIKHPNLYAQIISLLHFQIGEVPDNLFLDIVESKNFLAASLTTLFANVKENSSSLPPQLVAKAKRFKKNLMEKFKWNLTLHEDGDDAPVVVELPKGIETS